MTLQESMLRFEFPRVSHLECTVLNSRLGVLAS